MRRKYRRTNQPVSKKERHKRLLYDAVEIALPRIPASNYGESFKMEGKNNHDDTCSTRLKNYVYNNKNTLLDNRETMREKQLFRRSQEERTSR